MTAGAFEDATKMHCYWFCDGVFQHTLVDSCALERVYQPKEENS